MEKTFENVAFTREYQPTADDVGRILKVDIQSHSGFSSSRCSIAHACGVTEPRQLQRHHCRIVQADGRSMALDELYPEGID